MLKFDRDAIRKARAKLQRDINHGWGTVRISEATIETIVRAAFAAKEDSGLAPPLEELSLAQAQLLEGQISCDSEKPTNVEEEEREIRAMYEPREI